MEAEGERFGPFGGRYVPETLISALDELGAAYDEATADPAFREDLDLLLRDYVGRPSPLYRASRLEASVDGPPIFLKREDLNHTGAHKINNTIGQVLLARRMESAESSLRQGRANTAWPPPRLARSSISSASFTWAKSTWSGRR